MNESRRPYAVDRHAHLIEILKKHGYCSVSEMSQILSVSAMTIRRDLHTLADQQIVQLTHGGARLSLHRQAEPNFAVRVLEHLPAKQAIGLVAAQLIEAGDVIGIDGGSTVVEVARNLPEVPLTVITYSLPVADLVASNEQHSLLLLGGVFHRETLSFTSPQSITMLRGLRINKLFLAASGLLIPDGLSSSYLFDSDMKQALMSSARQVILCMDSSKIGQVFLAHFAALESVHILVTDSAITPEDREALERCSVQVIIAPALDHAQEDESATYTEEALDISPREM